ncbi:hypothetical protein [Serratia marcescens]|uniref:hypothetical protein n=1 Tax=Serratia marcescens TaxID=615 RepID=UPI003204AFF8
MTTIKRFNPDYKMHAARFEAFAREAEHGELVQFDDHQQVVSAVEVERDALAVENQALSAALSLISGSYGLSPHIQSMCAVDTPTTDSALAAIEARGVEKLIKLKMEQLANMHPDTHAFGATAESLRAQINELQAFATELREAK